MKKALVSLLFLLSVCVLEAQNYNNIVNYNLNDTPVYGIKIKTNLPFKGNIQLPLVKIEGYNPSLKGENPSILGLSIGWGIGGALNTYGLTVSSIGGIAPPVWLTNEGGKVIIFIDQRSYVTRFTVSAFAQGYGEKPEYFTGWTVVDEPLAGTHQALIPYKNVFGNINVNESAVIGSHVSPNAGSINRLSIIPYKHTGGSWNFVSRDTSSDAFLDLGYVNKIITINHRNKVGILTENPTCALDVNGTIRSKEVKIEATGWSDFVFNKDYKLPSLLDVETHIQEKGTLPDIPSEEEVMEQGINVGEMQSKLLQKIEELTLYVIELKKENEAQNKLIEDLNERVRGK